MRALLILLAACGASTPEGPRPAPLVWSNVLRADYAGSEACGDCHHEIYARWAASPMRNMTRDAKTAAITAPFEGATLTLGGDTATMTTVDGARVMRVNRETFRITKVIGGHYREDFVGVAADGVERVLPATYVFSSKSWRYKGYSVMVKERPQMSTRGVWSQECIACHNTMPLATLLYDELYGPSLPGYQGALRSRAATVQAVDRAGDGRRRPRARAR